MDRDSLKLLLDQGLSLAEIGRRFGRDESTIGYWVKKHGLRAVHADKHAARGELDKEILSALIDDGLSVRGISERTGYGPTSVRHWIKRHGLSTAFAGRRAEGRRAKAAGKSRPHLIALSMAGRNSGSRGAVPTAASNADRKGSRSGVAR